MIRRFPLVALAALGFVQFQATGQVPAGQTPPASADPYANNPDAGRLQFPLAAPAGKDTGAITKALPGGVNQGMIDPATWKYGPAFDPRAGGQAGGCHRFHAAGIDQSRSQTGE